MQGDDGKSLTSLISMFYQKTDRLKIPCLNRHCPDEGVLGGLTPAIESRLARIAAGTDQRGKVKPAPLRIKAGATLMRDWGGKSWRVEVNADASFTWDGRRWRSLSAIAREITGTSRNGPAFFGLRGGASHGAA